MRQLSIILLVMGCGCLKAQSLYNNGTLYISANTTLTVTDSLVNNSDITNNGEIIISGSWINNGIYNAGTGQLTLNGSQPQVINHNAQSFERLNISGGGEKRFLADITINNELILTNGILVSQNNAKIIIEDGANISGGADNSFVDGPIVQRGTGSKNFPLGKNNVYLPLELTSVSGNLPEIQFQVTEPNPNLSVDITLEQVSPVRYWEMSLLSGTFQGSPITLPLRNESSITDLSRAVVAQSDDLNAPYASLDQTSITGDNLLGTITSGRDISKNLFTIAVTPPLDLIELLIYNAVSPNNDGKHDFLKIINIELFPNNEVKIYNRWGDPIYEAIGYDNDLVKFEGVSNVNGTNQINDGTYYYTIDKGDGSDVKNGFFVLRR